MNKVLIGLGVLALLFLCYVIRLIVRLCSDLHGRCEKCNSPLTVLVKKKKRMPSGGKRRFKIISRHCWKCHHEVEIASEGHEDDEEFPGWTK